MHGSNLNFRSANAKRRILVIEDEMINREILGIMLGDNYDVSFAETGAEALKILETQHGALSLLLLDLNLPDMAGIDILIRIKSDGRTARLPVIVMTADQNSEVECLELGATDFISKPYPKQEIVLARIQRTIELFEDRDTILRTERDQLTGLYNREFFYRYAAQFDVHHPDTPTDAIMLDINHFHMINERYGRHFGDEVLKRVAEKLGEAVGESEGILCRRDGDTFLIYCAHRGDYGEILERASVDMNPEYQVRVRMGVYAETDRSIDIEHRFDRAKQAVDTVKNSYSHAIGYYDSSMHEKELYNEQLLEDFRAAVREKQFAVYYQPKFDIRSEKPVLNSAEALVRWKHPKLGMISPGVFIPLFEENGLIRELDSYVWTEVARQICAWKRTLGRSIPVSVNVSRIDLNDPPLLRKLEGIVDDAGIRRSEFLLEITESAYTGNAENMVRVVNSLREKGFVIEMDDFGSGYSSLNMITALPIDALKLDMQFIRSAFRERKDTRLLKAVVGLAQSLELPTIAEGVETAEQAFTLKSMGCDIIQGYYFSKPLPADEFEAYVRGLDEEAAEIPSSGDRSARGARPSDEFTYEAMHDPLTGLYNNSAFEVLFRDADHDHIAVMIASVDGFDAFGKENGKAGADKLVKRVAGVLRDCFRSVDSVCRLQDDEFAVIMSRMNSSMRELVVEKTVQINEMLKNAPEGEYPASLSFGVAFSDRTDPKGDIFEDADFALRRLKQAGQTGCAVY